MKYLAIAALMLWATLAAMISVMFAILNVKAAHAHRMKGWEIRQSGTPPCTWSIASKCKRGIRPWARH
jgi:hypothetical protein